MSDIAVANKTCRDCGETKPLSEFHRNVSNKDGRNTYCKPCALGRVRDWKERRRAELGEEAWREYQAEKVRRHRASGRDEVSRLGSQAYTDATHELRRRHPEEFAALLRQRRYDLGLEIHE